MEPNRLIIVPQLPVYLRYQEWWPEELAKHLEPHFDSVIELGTMLPMWSKSSLFSNTMAAMELEMQQVKQYMEMPLRDGDVLLHCDLSYPGLFHSALFHKRPTRAVAICHATALNRYDIFHQVRKPKWRTERSHAELYDKVLVATQYHADKLHLPNVEVMRGLPNPPASLLPPTLHIKEKHEFCSTARPCQQKVDREVERVLARKAEKVKRYTFRTWQSYYQFLDTYKFLVVTSKEETYGYQVVDAVLRGCVPIAPRAFSFPELLPDHLLYNADAVAEDRADEIISIANRFPGQKVELLNQKHIDHFYTKLVRILKGRQ